MKKHTAIIAALMLTVVTSSCGDARVSNELQKRYLSELDSWVARGGPMNEVQRSLVETCGKFAMAVATPAEAVKLSTTDRSEFDFRVDVCVKMTVNRIHPQPEFEDPKLVGAICAKKTNRLFDILCEHFGFRQ